MRSTFILAVFLTLPIVALGQIEAEHKLVTSGGGPYRGGTWTGNATVGLPIVGSLSGSTYKTKLGLYGQPKTKSVSQSYHVYVDVTMLDFGDVQQGQSKTLAFQIKNTSISDGAVSVHVSPAHDSRFSVANTAAAVNRGESANINVTLNAIGSGSIADSVIVTGLRPIDSAVVYLRGRVVLGVTLPKASPVLSYPDPAAAMLRISFPIGEVVNSVQVIDITGRSVDVVYDRDDQSLLVRTANLPNGAYTLVVRSAQRTNTSRIIIQH